MHTISIALATYNGGKYIEAQLDSLERQNLLPVELVVCDDASTDNTLELVNAFAARSSFPVRIFVNDTRLGYRDNFMKAASLCEGDLIAFCDQDDIWHAQKLLNVERRFSDADVLLVSHNAEILTSDGRTQGRVHLSDATEDTVYEPLCISPWNFPLGFTMTFRRDLLAFSQLRSLSLDYFDASKQLAHDQWIFLLAVIFGKMVRVADVLADYRQHDANTFGLKRRPKSFISRIKEKFTKFVNFDAYEDACRQIVHIVEQSASLSLNDRMRAKIPSASKFFGRMTDIYAARYGAYSGSNLFLRGRLWFSLRAIGGYDESSACHFERKEGARDFLLGVVMGGLCRKRHSGPAMDWSLVVNPDRGHGR